MTRREFDEIAYTSDLLDFCYEIGCDIADEIYNSDGRDEYIQEYQMRDYETWQGLLQFLESIPTGYDWYYMDDYRDGWYGFDDGDSEFDDLKNRIFEWAMGNDAFDEEDEEEEEENEEEPEYGITDPEAIDDEVNGPSLFQLCFESSGMLRQLQIDSEEAARRRAEEDAAEEAEFARLLTMAMNGEARRGNDD